MGSHRSILTQQVFLPQIKNWASGFWRAVRLLARDLENRSSELELI